MGESRMFACLITTGELTRCEIPFDALCTTSSIRLVKFDDLGPGRWVLRSKVLHVLSAGHKNGDVKLFHSTKGFEIHENSRAKTTQDNSLHGKFLPVRFQRAEGPLKWSFSHLMQTTDSVPYFRIPLGSREWR
jgi:hypothetical protein